MLTNRSRNVCAVVNTACAHRSTAWRLPDRIPCDREGGIDRRASVVQHDADERVVDLELAVVLDEPELPELVHEEVHARACRADHFRERLLRDLRQHAVW